MSAAAMPETEAVRLITKAQFAGRLQVTRRTIERLMMKGQLPPEIRFGRSIRWQEADVNAWIDALKVKPR